MFNEEDYNRLNSLVTDMEVLSLIAQLRASEQKYFKLYNETQPNKYPFKYIKLISEARYLEDAYVNEVNEDEDNPSMPCLNGNIFEIIVDVDTGKIINWELGKTARVYYKTADQNIISILSADYAVLGVSKGYVPKVFANKDEYGYDLDYLHLIIDQNGYIEGFKPIDIMKLISQQ